MNSIEVNSQELEAILAGIKAGNLPSSRQLLPFLLAEDRVQRWKVNFRLAAAYFESPARDNNLLLAKTCVQRAWLLSHFSPEVIKLFVDIHTALGDSEAIRAAYKRSGIEAAKRKNIAGAVHYFNAWHYTEAHLKRTDTFQYDFDILDSLDRLAESCRTEPKLTPGKAASDKIVVGYLVKGIVEQNSVLVKLNLLFAKYHDHNRFQIIIFVPESHQAIVASTQGTASVEQFAAYGCKVVVLDEENYAKRLVKLGREMYRHCVDILVTGAVLADFGHYFITRLCPAVPTVNLIQGPPPQFSSPLAARGISWTMHPLLDSPVDASLVKMELEYLSAQEIAPSSREALGLPADAFVLLSAGRHVKFQDKDYWNAIVGVLGAAPHVHYVVVGAKEEQLPFLDSVLPQPIKSRVHFVAWADHYQRLLLLADLYLDTYPSGGGVTLEESMALGIPFVSFENNYLKMYDQVDWSPAQELFYHPESILPRGDFAAFSAQVSRLIADAGLRARLGSECQRHILSSKGQPARAVRKCEEIFGQVFQRNREQKVRMEGGVWPGAKATAGDLNAYQVNQLLRMVVSTISFRVRKKIKRLLAL